MSSQNPYGSVSPLAESHDSQADPFGVRRWKRFSYISAFSGAAMVGFVCGLARDGGFVSALGEISSQPLFVVGVNAAIWVVASTLVGMCCHFVQPYRSYSAVFIRASAGGFTFAFLLYGSFISDLSTGLAAAGYNELAARIDSLPGLVVYGGLLAVATLADLLAGRLISNVG